MKFRILAVGRGMPEPIRALVADYRGRLAPFGGAELLEVADARRSADSPAHRQRWLAEEAERLNRVIARSGVLIALDSRGRALSSPDLATALGRLRDEGLTEIQFLVGGPDGLDEALLGQARWSLSLGPMTLPHMLARVVLLEQLYRAMTILRGIPYHR